MKVETAKKYKRKLSKAAIDRMSEGGRNGSMEDKRKAGKLGWQAMFRSVQLGISPGQKAGGK